MPALVLYGLSRWDPPLLIPWPFAWLAEAISHSRQVDGWFGTCRV